MNLNQRQEAYDYAQVNYDKLEVGLQADVRNGEGFDEVEDGVWVSAWVKVPADRIPGYRMTPPAPASTVTTYKHPFLNVQNDG